VADVETNVGTLSAEGFFSLLRGRVLETDYDVTGRDQALIVKDLIDTAQGYTEGDMLIETAGIAAVGKTRDRSWAASEWKDVGEAIEDMAAVRDGYDFRTGVSWGASAPVRTFYVQYPATGRVTDFVLELGRNLELLSLSVDATQVVNKVYARGEEGEDGVPLTTSIHNTGTGFARRDAVVTNDDVRNLSTLLDHAQRKLDRGSQPIRIPSVSLNPSQEPALGSFIVGDIVEVRGVFGAVDFGGSYRITAWAASVDTAGMESLSLTLAPLEVFA